MVNFAYYYSLLFRYHFLIESKVLSTFHTCQSYLVCMCFIIMNTKTYFLSNRIIFQAQIKILRLFSHKSDRFCILSYHYYSANFDKCFENTEIINTLNAFEQIIIATFLFIHKLYDFTVNKKRLY